MGRIRCSSGRECDACAAIARWLEVRPTQAPQDVGNTSDSPLIACDRCRSRHALDRLARMAHDATGIAVAGCRTAILPWMATLEEGGGRERPSSRDASFAAWDTRAAKLLRERVRTRLRRLSSATASRPLLARALRLSEAQLGVYRALVSFLSRDQHGDSTDDVTTSTRLSPGTVYWVTGMSGAGKSTFARSLCSALRKLGKSAVNLDGDDLRRVVAGPPIGIADGGSMSVYALEARRRIAFEYAQLARLIALTGDDVVIATVSGFRDVQMWNRQRIERYVEIWIDTPRDRLIERDSKGLYSRYANGEVSNLAGFDLPYEAPVAPDFHYRNVAGVRALQRYAHVAVAASTNSVT